MKTVAMAMSKRPLPDVKTAGVLGQMLVNPIAAASPTCASPPTIVPTSNTTMLISVVNCTIQLQRTSCQAFASSSCSTLMLFFNIFFAILRKKRRRLKRRRRRQERRSPRCIAKKKRTKKTRAKKVAKKILKLETIVPSTSGRQ